MTMTFKQARLFREIYEYNAYLPGAPFLVDGPRRVKMAAEMAAAGWLDDHGPIGAPIPLGHAYRVNQAGIDAHNASLEVVP